MITTLLRIGWMQHKRDRMAQLLSLVLPLVFFSIFAVIFGGLGAPRAPRPHVAVVDEAHNAASARLIAALRAEKSLEVSTQGADGRPFDARSVRAMVADGTLSVAIVIPAGFEAAVLDPGRRRIAATVLADISDPMGPPMVSGLLQAAISRGLPDLLLRRDLTALEASAGIFTEAERQLLAGLSGRVEATAGSAKVLTGEPVKVVVEDVIGGRKKNPSIAYYAASTGVLFLLFTMSGSAGNLLDEESFGVLERLLRSQLTMSRLLIGRWIYNSLYGMVQVTLMFVWGSLLFKLDLWTPGHLLGFALMTLATATAASAFGLVLATACRTRGQLNGVSSIVVLTMSALGGSMFPRFLMPGWMQNVGLLTFNAWALDGYRKVFWYDTPPLALWPQLSVLLALGLGCLLLARRLARRWEIS